MLIEPILLYRSETWTLITCQQQWLAGTYTNLLWRAQNIHWSEHVTHERICCNLPPLSQKLAKQRLQFAGHCQRAMGEIIQSLLLWKPSGPVHSRRATFSDVIARDSGIDRSDLGNTMADREVWSTVACIPTSRVERWWDNIVVVWTVFLCDACYLVSFHLIQPSLY